MPTQTDCFASVFSDSAWASKATFIQCSTLGSMVYRGEEAPTPGQHFCPSHLERDRAAQKEACCLFGRTKTWNRVLGFLFCFIWREGSCVNYLIMIFFCLQKKKLASDWSPKPRGGNEKTRVSLWLAGHPPFDRLLATAGTCDSFLPLLYRWMPAFSFSPRSPSPGHLELGNNSRLPCQNTAWKWVHSYPHLQSWSQDFLPRSDV